MHPSILVPLDTGRLNQTNKMAGCEQEVRRVVLTEEGSSSIENYSHILCTSSVTSSLQGANTNRIPERPNQSCRHNSGLGSSNQGSS